MIAQDYETLKTHLGKREYNFENFGKDSFTEKFFIPYPINKNSNLKLGISKHIINSKIKIWLFRGLFYVYRQ